MKEGINLKKLERTTAGNIFKSGVVDISVGLVWLVVSMAMIFDDYRYYIDALLIVPLILLPIMLKYLVTPRAGYVKLTRKRTNRTMLLMVTITVFLIIMVSMTLFGRGESSELLISPRILISVIIFSICVAVAYFLAFDRMYLYAFLLTASFNWSEEIREHPLIFSKGGYAYMVAAIIAILIGSYCLAKFLKENPLPKENIEYGK